MSIGDIDVRISTDPRLARATYVRACVDAGVRSSTAGYKQWRKMCQRLLGESDFEAAIQRATAALAALADANAATTVYLTVNEARALLHLPPLEEK
jgi:hypothetical protein